jgi:hypothetical protein
VAHEVFGLLVPGSQLGNLVPPTVHHTPGSIWREEGWVWFDTSLGWVDLFVIRPVLPGESVKNFKTRKNFVLWHKYVSRRPVAPIDRFHPSVTPVCTVRVDGVSTVRTGVTTVQRKCREKVTER